MTTPLPRDHDAAQRVRENAPRDLLDRPQWVVWRYEWVTSEKTGEMRQTKVLYQPRRPSHKARTNAPLTWSAFSLAEMVYGKHAFDGVGFVISADDPFTGIDPDDCRDPETGEIEAWAMAIVDQMDSYTEISPSGKGLRIFVYGELRHAKRRKGSIEIYDRGRFFTITGNRLAGPQSPAIEERQEALDALAFAAFAEEESQERPAPDGSRVLVLPTSFATAEVIRRASEAKNGAKFRRLFGGDAGDYGQDWSRADMALCGMLAFWIGPDASRIDAAFRASGLMRAKWDEKRGESTYGERTITTVLALPRERYTPPSATVTPLRPGGGSSGGSDADDPTDGGDLPPEEPSKPSIITSARQLHELTTEATLALELANTPPTLFRRGGHLARVRADECERPILDLMNERMLRARLARIADFFRITQSGERVNCSPPETLAINILAQPDWPAFPGLVGITESPTIRPDGSILREPGYDPATRLYYAPARSLALPRVPDRPSQRDARNAITFLKDDVLHDFPFDGEASLAAILALLVTTVVRPAIDGKVPLALVTAPAPGTGKGLVAELPAVIATGRKAASMAAPAKEEEWGKKLTATLMPGPTIVLIDNVHGILRSAELEHALTTEEYTDRVLGLSLTVTLPQRAIWIATGNNLQLAGDLPRRCYRIRLDAQMAKPWQRAEYGFTHPDLHAWVRAHRGRILAELLTIARAWYADGCPRYETPAMGSFENWARIVGSILAHAGVTGFLDDLEQMYAESDTERPQYAAFFSAWYDCHHDMPVTAATIAAEALAEQHPLHGTLPEAIMPSSYSNAGALARKLGYTLRAQVAVRYDLDDGSQVYLEKAGQDRLSAARWHVRKLNRTGVFATMEEDWGISDPFEQ